MALDKKNKKLDGTLQSAFDSNNKEMFILILNELVKDKVFVESDKDKYMQIYNNWDKLQTKEDVVIFGGNYGYRIINDGIVKRQCLVM